MTISNGGKVSIEYTAKCSDGSIADTNVGDDPLVYTQGEGQLLPALEVALLGLQRGATMTVELKAHEAYGTVNPDAYENISKDQIPEDLHQPGVELAATTKDGTKIQVRVHEVKEEHIVIDFNHPLAGQDLTFDIKIISIE